ncbi:MAG TPA: GlsB/YeaQ/YmgE family stress response membrane protein [Candidatus Saccharimonadales bacterium]|nr:GlsB/YeaQ/YmgE family stress response membrane protein [Candidatus Saccharimonadales bacterium]
MDILYWIIFGLIAGSIANFIIPGIKGGIIGSIILGIIGAVVGGYLGQMFFGVGVTGFNLSSFVVAIIGSLIVLIVVGSLSRKRQT